MYTAVIMLNGTEYQTSINAKSYDEAVDIAVASFTDVVSIY